MRIIYFAPIPYHGLRQRPQYLADGLAKEHEIIYVNPTVSFLKCLFKKGIKPWGKITAAQSGVNIVQLNGMWLLPRFMGEIWSGFNFLERQMLKKFLEDADAIWIGYEPWFDFINDFSGKIIYDQMDDNAELTSNPWMKRLILRTRSELLSRADVLFVSAQKFYKEALQKGLHPILLPNAVDGTQAFQKAASKFPKSSNIRIFGYVGMIARWFDLDVIHTILDAAPENQVVLVGPEEIERIEDSRVHYIGPVPKTEVNAWISSFDVCLYPFCSSSFLDTINPVKIYEYLAQNKPVIAVQSLETQQFHEKIYLYESMEQLRELLDFDLKPPFCSENECLSFIDKNSWEARMEIVLEELKRNG